MLNARCAGGALSGAVKPTGQAHHRVRLAEEIDPIDKDRRRSGKPQFLGLRVGVNPSEPNIDCGSTDGIEGMPQPLPGDRQAGAALDEPDFNVHPSIMRLLATCRRDSGLCLVVGPLGATAADAALSVVFVKVLRAGAEGVGIRQHGVDLPLLTGWTGGQPKVPDYLSRPGGSVAISPLVASWSATSRSLRFRR